MQGNLSKQIDASENISNNVLLYARSEKEIAETFAISEYVLHNHKKITKTYWYARGYAEAMKKIIKFLSK